MVEEKARFELGMIKPDEILVQLSTPAALNASPAGSTRRRRCSPAPSSLWGAPVTWLEILAFGLAVAMVVCNIRVNSLGWPLAIASSLLYFLLFWKSRLYGDASLQIFFVAVAGWGWWQWLRGTDAAGRALRVRTLGARGRWIALARARPRLAGDRPLPRPLHRHRRALVGRVPDRGERPRPVAARPQVRRELAGLDRRQRRRDRPVRLQGAVADGRAVRAVRRDVGGRLARLAAAGRGRGRRDEPRLRRRPARRREHRQDDARRRRSAPRSPRAARGSPSSARYCASSATAKARTPRRDEQAAHRRRADAAHRRRGRAAHEIVVADTTRADDRGLQRPACSATRASTPPPRRRSAAAT